MSVSDLILGTGSTGLSHTVHDAFLAVTAVFAAFLLLRLVCAVGRLSRQRQAPSFASRPRSGRRAAALVIGGILLFGWAYDKAHPAVQAAVSAGQPAPASSPSPSPSPSVITHTVIQRVNAHPLLSGTDWVLIALICAIALVGSISLLSLRRG
jgi:hypothetical protein